MYPICILYVPYMYPLCIQYVSYVYPIKWSQSDPKMVQNRSKSDPKVIQKWSKTDPKVIQRRSSGVSWGPLGVILGSIPIFQHWCQKWMWKQMFFAHWTQKNVKNWRVFEGQTHFDCKNRGEVSTWYSRTDTFGIQVGGFWGLIKDH